MLWLDLILALLGGLLAGGLVNYLADVLPATRRLSVPPWWPLTHLSLRAYLSRARVAWVLASYGLAGLALVVYPPLELSAPLMLALLVYFGVVSVIDLEHRAILHQVSVAGAILFAGWGFLRHGWLATLLGGAVGFGSMLVLYYFGDLFGRWLAQRRGEAWEETALGFGDVNLAGVIGLLLGWPSVLGGLMLGVFAGGAFSAAYILVQLVRGRYRAFVAIPFGPFLSLGALLLIVLRAYT